MKPLKSTDQAMVQEPDSKTITGARGPEVQPATKLNGISKGGEHLADQKSSISDTAGNKLQTSPGQKSHGAQALRARRWALSVSCYYLDFLSPIPFRNLI